MKKKILTLAVVTTCLIFFVSTSHAQKNSDTVYYFIDTDIRLSGKTGTDDTKGIYASSPIRTALWQERGNLVAGFKAKLKEKFPDQAGINIRVVFRWQPAMDAIKESYAVEEEKMKKQHYSIVQVE